MSTSSVAAPSSPTPRRVSSASSSPAQQPRREAVAPLDLAEERLAVLRVADGARRDEQRPLGAERLGGAAVVGEGVADARDREGEEAAARVDALAEARDPRLAVQLLDAAVLDVARRAGASCSCRGRPRRRSLAGEVGGDPPDGAVDLVERRAQDGELRERDAQALEALLQLGRRLARRRRAFSAAASALRGEVVEPAEDVPAACPSTSRHARSARTASSARAAIPASTATIERRPDRPVPHRDERNEGATIGATPRGGAVR